jgi:tetratricopeptide (TPR) repeat protein
MTPDRWKRIEDLLQSALEREPEDRAAFLDALQEALDMDPSFAITHLDLGLVYLEKGMYKEAIAAFQKGRTLSGGDPDMIALAGYGYARSGKKSEAQKALVELNELSRHRYVSPFERALIHIGLGEKGQAFEWLEKSYDQRSWHMGLLKVHPLFDSLRTDPRFADLLRRVGFPR